MFLMIFFLHGWIVLNKQENVYFLWTNLSNLLLFRLRVLTMKIPEHKTRYLNAILARFEHFASVWAL